MVDPFRERDSGLTEAGLQASETACARPSGGGTKLTRIGTDERGVP
jgi:hypothetical protein